MKALEKFAYIAGYIFIGIGIGISISAFTEKKLNNTKKRQVK